MKYYTLCLSNTLKDFTINNMKKTGLKGSVNFFSVDFVKCKFDGRKCHSNQWWNNDKCRCECKKHHICEKDYIGNPATCSCENGNYLASIQ